MFVYSVDFSRGCLSLSAESDCISENSPWTQKKNKTKNKKQNKQRPVVQKLITSLANVSLKFPTLISQIRQHFLMKICEKLFIFSTKNISLVGYKVVKYLTRWPLNELIRLTMLWTTGRWLIPMHPYININISEYYSGSWLLVVIWKKSKDC